MLPSLNLQIRCRLTESKDDYITFAFLDESKSVVVPVSLEKALA
ncbi:hypothetical protein PO124_16425 [Bacillus licheniformis]|nr:hypothetical protein [Bacillus licheniformis]